MECNNITAMNIHLIELAAIRRSGVNETWHLVQTIVIHTTNKYVCLSSGAILSVYLNAW